MAAEGSECAKDITLHKAALAASRQPPSAETIPVPPRAEVNNRRILAAAGINLLYVEIDEAKETL
jgi:hypothetical protein